MKSLCPKCAGGVEFDSEGGRLSCYFCCDTGEVDAAVAAEFERSQAWGYYVAAEKAIQKRAALGVPAGYGYYFDDYDGELVLVPPPGERVAMPAWCVDNDIPF